MQVAPNSVPIFRILLSPTWNVSMCALLWEQCNEIEFRTMWLTSDNNANCNSKQEDSNSTHLRLCKHVFIYCFPQFIWFVCADTNINYIQNNFRIKWCQSKAVMKWPCHFCHLSLSTPFPQNSIWQSLRFAIYITWQSTKLSKNNPWTMGETKWNGDKFKSNCMHYNSNFKLRSRKLIAHDIRQIERNGCFYEINN